MAASIDVDVTIAESSTPAGGSKPPSRAIMIVMLGALVALGPLTIDMYLPALPKIADDLSVSSSVAQLTLTGTLAGLALGQLIVGPLSDSLGRRRPLMAGIVLHMLASVLCMFARTRQLGVARTAGDGRRRSDGGGDAAVGDLLLGLRRATVMSRLMLVLGSPVVALSPAPPAVESLVALGSAHWCWRAGCFSAALALPETLPASHRRAAGCAARRHLCRGLAMSACHAGAGRRARMSGLFAYYRRCVVRAAGPLRPDQQAFALVLALARWPSVPPSST
jgi:DHA1 family bicyclomycin/chloramphenicol resistance-like MFS transporter